MKKLLLVSALLCCVAAARAQAPLHYEYASLNIDGAYFWGYIFYDDGQGGMTRDTVKVPNGTHLAAARFRHFHYLNAKGYELVTQSGMDFTFRRKKQ